MNGTRNENTYCLELVLSWSYKVVTAFFFKHTGHYTFNYYCIFGTYRAILFIQLFVFIIISFCDSCCMPTFIPACIFVVVSKMYLFHLLQMSHYSVRSAWGPLPVFSLPQIIFKQKITYWSLEGKSFKNVRMTVKHISENKMFIYLFELSQANLITATVLIENIRGIYLTYQYVLFKTKNQLVQGVYIFYFVVKINY